MLYYLIFFSQVFFGSTTDLQNHVLYNEIMSDKRFHVYSVTVDKEPFSLIEERQAEAMAGSF